MRSILALALAFALALGASTAARASFSAAPSSCEAGGLSASCTFACDLGDSLTVLAVATNGADTVRADVQCGGVDQPCVGTGGCFGVSTRTAAVSGNPLAVSLGTCSVSGAPATIVCVSSVSPIGFSTTGGISCVATGENSCYYVCATGHSLFAQATSPYSWSPAYASTSCGDSWVDCSGTHACYQRSALPVGTPLGLGACRSLSGSTTATCGML